MKYESSLLLIQISNKLISAVHEAATLLIALTHPNHKGELCSWGLISLVIDVKLISIKEIVNDEIITRFVLACEL